MKNKRISGAVLDRLLCCPVFGLPFFFAVLSFVLFLSFGSLGDALERILEAFLSNLGKSLAEGLLTLGASDHTVRYLIGGIYASFASAIAFLPQTLLFFLLIRMLDDCGYLSRAVFVTDRLFRVFGLSGNAVIPLMLGYGCAVSSVCACRCSPSEETAVTYALPFVPCNARLPVLLFLADSFFPRKRVLFAVFVFALSFWLIFVSLLLTPAEANAPAVTAQGLPKYRTPRIRDLFFEIKQKSREYLLRAVTAVLLCSAVFSALAMLTPALRPAEEPVQSTLYILSEKISFIFRPLGFDRGEITAALIFGFFAKENMISVLQILSDGSLLGLSFPAAISFSVFAAFYAPCASLCFAVARRAGTARAIKLLLRTFTYVYLLSFIFYWFSHIIFIYCSK